MTTEIKAQKFHFLDEGGELGHLTRTYDWETTPVGSPDTWPQSLRTTVSIILHSEFPMFLWWGPDMIQFYNDAYRPSLGENGKHPHALGQKGKDCWPEIWDIIYPLIKQVQHSGKSFFIEDRLVPIFRNGSIEDVYWTFSYSAVIGETGNIDGVLVVCHETTDKVETFKKLEASQRLLLESSNNLTNTIMRAPAAMCILKGPQFVVEIPNDKMLELWGKTREDVLNKPLFEGLTEASGQGFEEILTNVYRTGESYVGNETPVTLPRNNGIETVYVNFLYEALREKGGDVTGIIAVAMDVTAQTTARKRLEENEHRVRSLVTGAPFPIAVYEGREMRIVLANQAIVDVWGKGDAWIGNTYYDLLPELESQQIYPLLDGVYTTGIPFHARNQQVDLVVKGKLTPFYFNYSFTPLVDTTGSVYGVLNTAADVTDLNIAKQRIEQSEANFRSMILKAPVAMCILLGPDHVVEIANELMIELWGKPAESVLGKPIFEGLPDAREQGLEKMLSDVYNTGITFKASERPVELFRKGKIDTVYQDFVYEPYRDADGKILGVLAITIDVTDQVFARRKIEEVVAERTRELATTNSDLQKSNAELAQFAYIASHDLQEPLRKIRTFSQMLETKLGDQLNDTNRNYLHKITTSSGRMQTLIRDVLAYSELIKKVDLFEKVDLNKIIDDIKTDFELAIEQKKATISHEKLPVLEAIPLQMSQLFSNLISNAMKFSKPGINPTIVITVFTTSNDDIKRAGLLEGREYCGIRLADNGIGFREEFAEQIFHIFQRLHRKSEFEGTGIGLAICKKVVANHEGSIDAAGSSPQGAVFNIILPIRQV